MNVNNRHKKSFFKKGTKDVSINDCQSGFYGSQPMLSVYVGGCSRDTTCDAIKTFCAKQDVTIVEIDELQSRNTWSRSLKLTAHGKDKDVLFSEAFWPKGVILRRFYYSKKKST